MYKNTNRGCLDRCYTKKEVTIFHSTFVLLEVYSKDIAFIFTVFSYLITNYYFDLEYFIFTSLHKSLSSIINNLYTFLLVDNLVLKKLLTFLG